MTRMCSHGGETAVRKGPWTLEEDLVLVSYICQHGEGSWDKLARSAGLNRNGKSCRLRWLNYLRPGVRRGSISPEEDVLIRELHSRWGNKWSKIAKHLPGRTDNEIKNYWRTRIQKKSSTGCARHPLVYYHNAMATTTSEASTASASQAGSTVDDGHVQSSCLGTNDVDAMARQYFSSDCNENFWNIVDNFWAANPALDTV